MECEILMKSLNCLQLLYADDGNDLDNDPMVDYQFGMKKLTVKHVALNPVAT